MKLLFPCWIGIKTRRTVREHLKRKLVLNTVTWSNIFLNVLETNANICW